MIHGLVKEHVKVGPELPIYGSNAAHAETEAGIHLGRYASVSKEATFDHFSGAKEALTYVFQAGDKVVHQMVLLHGSENQDCTSFLINATHLAKQILKHDFIFIPRFVGLTSESFLPSDLLNSLCTQLSLVLKTEMPKPSTCDAIFVHFQTLLQKVFQQKKHLLIVLDNLEKLHTMASRNNEHTFSWLLGKLPPGVHIVGTYSTNRKNLQTFKHIYKTRIDDKYKIDMPQLTIEESQTILKNKFHSCDKKIQESIIENTVDSYKNSHEPCSPDLVFHRLSYFQLDDFAPVLDSQEALINWIFDYVEDQYGHTVISTTAQYISGSKLGLSELEMLDILSCNNDVMSSYVHDEGGMLLRFPSSVWIDVRQSLGKTGG